MILFYIKLTAIAGGEDRSFAAVGESAELLQGLNQLLRVKATRSRTSTEAVLWLIPSARKAIHIADGDVKPAIVLLRQIQNNYR
jgi:hypothetical protein